MTDIILDIGNPIVLICLLIAIVGATAFIVKVLWDIMWE